MEKAHASTEKESLKKHGDVMENAIKDADRHTAGSQPDPVPMPDNGSHEKSHAAHLGDAHEHTKPEGNLRHGAAPGELREPPMVQQRIGKQHK
jgi:hypothetical protein